MDQIRIGIVGYGNLGRGVEYALRQNPDMALVGVFTRRPPSSLTLQTPGVPVYPLDALDGMEGAVDVLLLCGGSAADLPERIASAHRLFLSSLSFFIRFLTCHAIAVVIRRHL